MKVGDLIIGRETISIHDFEGHVGVILSPRSKHGQYKVYIIGKILYMFRGSFDKMKKFS